MFEWWSDLPPIVRYGVALLLLAISTVLWFCGNFWPWVKRTRAAISSTCRVKLRWFQFSLRSMVILTTLVALFLGYFAHQARKREHALGAVRRLGGTIFYNNDAPEFVNRLLGETWFARVVAIDLAFTEANDNDVEQLGNELRQLNGIAWLRISGTPISASGASRLRKTLPDILIYKTPGVPHRLKAERDMIPMSWGETPWKPAANNGLPQNTAGKPAG